MTTLKDLLKADNVSDGSDRDEKYSDCEKDIKALQEKIKEKLAESARTLPKIFDEKTPDKIPLAPPLRERRTLKGHFGKIYGLAWSGDGAHIVSASQDGKIIVCFYVFFKPHVHLEKKRGV
ncbi:guanine nucleotide-binding protein beta subunit [Reticulomyxa filosa]|uniref:Guanine nucleotide-binding protein beta subunit n=1 Tax=Reticulomyxa filosa TaxID=46433 RepID=X6MQU7_RETFI|nr:guanine nucleotide-binding protein beta subunit [Reticulomyxa filosa]|eukprot:ETO16026.1 guanine nucleotide-binding protein beta subunit [Reticulomyxa filosa]